MCISQNWIEWARDANLQSLQSGALPPCPFFLYPSYFMQAQGGGSEDSASPMVAWENEEDFFFATAWLS